MFTTFICAGASVQRCDTVLLLLLLFSGPQLINCDIRQFCSQKSRKYSSFVTSVFDLVEFLNSQLLFFFFNCTADAYFWMSIHVEVKEGDKNEQDVQNLVRTNHVLPLIYKSACHKRGLVWRISTFRRCDAPEMNFALNCQPSPLEIWAMCQQCSPINFSASVNHIHSHGVCTHVYVQYVYIYIRFTH